MPFCRNCGHEMTVDATFCPSCGARAVLPQAGAFVPPHIENEFDRLTHDSRTQDFWVRRVIAYIIDAIIVGIVASILSIIIFLFVGFGSGLFFGTFFASAFSPFSAFTGLSALLFILYFTFADALYHRTLGKNIMGLQVATIDGSPLDIGKCFVRNVSKIYWLLLLLDLIGGFFLHVKPGQKYSDHIANTVIVRR
ncbi:MAG: RDD family protein [Nitrososphaerales archaeon]